MLQNTFVIRNDSIYDARLLGVERRQFYARLGFNLASASVNLGNVDARDGGYFDWTTMFFK
jgi:hypothetical protein